jgi:hypothetical protein
MAWFDSNEYKGKLFKDKRIEDAIYWILNNLHNGFHFIQPDQRKEIEGRPITRAYYYGYENRLFEFYILTTDIKHAYEAERHSWGDYVIFYEDEIVFRAKYEDRFEACEILPLWDLDPILFKDTDKWFRALPHIRDKITKRLNQEAKKNIKPPRSLIS